MKHQDLFIDAVDNFIEINGEAPLDGVEHYFVKWASKNMQQPSNAYWEVKKRRMGAASVHPVLDALYGMDIDDKVNLGDDVYGVY